MNALQRFVALFIAGVLTAVTVWLLLKVVAFVGPRFEALPPGIQVYVRVACYLLVALPGIIIMVRYWRGMQRGKLPESEEGKTDDE